MATNPIPHPIRQDKTLRLNYSGRIIDHLGIQMYQSPVAAIAELVANAWDADATRVTITLPEARGETAEVTVSDDGIGMKFQECQERFLKVGYARRGHQATERSPTKNRSILGRKGIGKFAGFGIAQVIQVETISEQNGERTVFEMDIDRIRSNDYIKTDGTEITVIDYEDPDEDRRRNHGTTVRLKHLSMQRNRTPQVFARSMARRFLRNCSGTPVAGCLTARGRVGFGGPGAVCATLVGYPPCPPRPSPSSWPSWPPTPCWPAIRSWHWSASWLSGWGSWRPS